jgi:hypothetical protein
MKFNYLRLLLILLLFSCNNKPVSITYPRFFINKYQVDTVSNVVLTLPYKSSYFSLTDKNRLLCIGANFKIDNTVSHLINKIQVDHIFVLSDTLFAIKYIKNHLPLQFWLNDSFQWVCINRFFKDPEIPVFEDEKFIVHSCCFGEFGGAVFFKEKSTDRVFSCPSTCVQNINKIDGVYYVTNTLQHLVGSSRILKIVDPTKLYELKTDSLKRSCNWYMSIINFEQIHSEVKTQEIMNKFESGSQKLIDTVGVLTIASFLYHNQLYNLNTNSEKTFISKIDADSLFVLQNLGNLKLFPADMGVVGKDKNTLVVPFVNFTTSGFVSILNDTISIATFKNNH